MGIIGFALLVFASVTGLVLACAWLRHQASFTKLSIDDLEGFVMAVDRPRLEEVLDSAKNEERRANPNNYCHRRDHRVALELLRGYLLVMLGNAAYLGHWGKSEWIDMRKHNCKYSVETIQRIKDLIRSATVFRKLARRALLVIWIWRLSRFEEWTIFGLPDVASLREIAGVDILEAYAQLRRAAEALSEEYGDAGKEIARYIGMKMLGPNEVGA